MQIRKATPEDATAIAEFLFLAMEDIIYQFIGRKNAQEAKDLLALFAGQAGNQYSYENTWIAEYEGSIAGAVCIYDGAKLYELRDPIAAAIRGTYKMDFNPEDETQAGEYYLDCIGVAPDMQGKGIGSGLLQFVIDLYVHQYGHTVGLLVDKENPGAKKLYLHKGFKIVGQKTFGGKEMEHLQFSYDKR